MSTLHVAGLLADATAEQRGVPTGGVLSHGEESIGRWCRGCSLLGMGSEQDIGSSEKSAMAFVSVGFLDGDDA